MNTFHTLSLASIRARWGDRRAGFTTAAACFTALFLSVVGAQPAAAQISGSMQTTVPDGATVNGNIFTSKGQVFFTAGPQNQRASGLPDGTYYFQVTDPSGSILLSNDPAACRQVIINGGRLTGVYAASGCQHASSSPNPATGIVAVQVGGAFRACPTGPTSPDMFCDTPNPGGEYKIWLIVQANAVSGCSPTVNADGFSLSFDQKCAKTANFKLALPAVSQLVACKFNDANRNGVLDPGELMISGWPITASVPSTSYVTLRFDNQAGASVTATTDSTGCVSFAASGIPGNTQIPVTVTEASELRWTQTAPANGTYDASGKPAQSGPTSVLGAAPASGVPASGGIISVNLGPGLTVTAPEFGNTNPVCPDCSILGTVTLVNTAMPNKLYTWGITKRVDKQEIDNVNPGGSASFNYTVTVTHDSGTGALLTGTITLINGDTSNPFVVLSVSDSVSDGGVCRIKDPSSGLYVPQVANLTLNSFTESTLTYQCSYTGGAAPSAGINTVTAANALAPSLQYTASAHYDFSTATAIADGSVAVTDTLKGNLGSVSATDASPNVYSYALTFTDPAATCTPHNNTATITTDTTAATSSASQSVKVCVNNPVTITTTPNFANVTLGTSQLVLKDSATLAGAVNPTGTITFRLSYGGQVVDVESVPVSGNGIYTTPQGYTIPTGATVVGTYQWDAIYSGDSTNPAVSESGNAAEQTVVLKAVTSLKGTSVSPESVQQLPPITVNLAGGYYPTGNLTLTVVKSADPSLLYCSVSTPVSGNGSYTFPATCFPPTEGEGVYVSAAYSGDGNNTVSAFDVGIYVIVL